MTLALVKENIRIALGAIRSNLLRTILTILIIGIGITALVGILTAISSIESAITNKFATMGANSFTIENRGMNIQIGKQKYRSKRHDFIAFREAVEFKEEFDFPAVVSVRHVATGSATVKYESEKTNPNVTVYGVDENFLTTSGHSIQNGRNFTVQEIQDSRHLAVLGSELVKKVFKNNVDPVDKVISVGGMKYKVIGVLKEKGAGFGSQSDNLVMLPVSNVRQVFSRPKMSYTIEVMVNNPARLQAGISEATGLFRLIRGLTVYDEDNFNITQSDNLAKILVENTSKITWIAAVIGVITLFGAAIGLMNIMLVAVAERTREIGIRKALGANRRTIRNQFLLESIVVGQLGGFLGVVLGIFIGNIMSMIMKSAFIVPWMWILLGVTVCFLVGLLSGLLPAIKAAKLDPIESLRYE